MRYAGWKRLWQREPSDNPVLDDMAVWELTYAERRYYWTRIDEERQRQRDGILGVFALEVYRSNKRMLRWIMFMQMWVLLNVVLDCAYGF